MNQHIEKVCSYTADWGSGRIDQIEESNTFAISAAQYRPEDRIDEVLTAKYYHHLVFCGGLAQEPRHSQHFERSFRMEIA